MAVSVVDNGQAQLEATATYTPEASFSNTYKAAAASLVVTASKTLNGGTLAADQFTFELVDQNGKVVQTAKNKADGTVEFPAVSFDAAGDYKFKIREKNEGAAGYTYDSTEFDVAVAVTDNGKGQLEAKATYAKEAAFSNTYKAAPTSVVVDATSVLKKGDKDQPIKADDFTIELLDKDGKVISELKTDEKGHVVFPALTYDAPGTYTYTLRQKKGDKTEITYDEKTYPVTVEVTDNGKGQLVVSKKENTSGVVFVNLLADNTPNQQGPGKPEEKKEEKKLPKTGESSSILLIGLAFVLVIAAVVVLFTRKNARN